MELFFNIVMAIMLSVLAIMVIAFAVMGVKIMWEALK